MADKSVKKGKKGRKIGRSKRKEAGRSKPLSRYVRGLITFSEYLRLSNPSRG